MHLSQELKLQEGEISTKAYDLSKLTMKLNYNKEKNKNSART